MTGNEVAAENATPVATENGAARQNGADPSLPALAATVFVVGGAGIGPDRNPRARDFAPTLAAAKEKAASHLHRFQRDLDAVIAAGGSHLVVPPAQMAWLERYPYLADYLADVHDLIEHDPDVGMVFALRPWQTPSMDVEVQGWTVEPGEGIRLLAESDLIEPILAFRPSAAPRRPARLSLSLRASGLRTLEVRCLLSSPDRKKPKTRRLTFSLDRPGSMFHTFRRASIDAGEDGALDIGIDLRLDRSCSLDRVEVAIVEDDNWRVHPTFPGGQSFALAAKAPAGATLSLQRIGLTPLAGVEKGPTWGTYAGPRPAPHRKTPGRLRDAVIFAGWIPDEGLDLGDYYIDVLQRHHADSRIFVGVNHGSSPEWERRLLASGLDVDVSRPSAMQVMPFDPTGFTVALDAFRRSPERFELAWFGHTKGTHHLSVPEYATGRWMIERMFWSRRSEIEACFRDPLVGVHAPHWLMLLQQHLTQIDALSRMYRDACLPLGAMAVSSHFAMRGEIVRRFCDRVDTRFFRFGAAFFGGDRYFVEMALPNIATMQGYEPVIEPGLGGTTGAPKMDGVESVLNDWRQNNAMVTIELEKWRRDPTGFVTRHCEHIGVD